jgi:hypothetical protein
MYGAYPANASEPKGHAGTKNELVGVAPDFGKSEWIGSPIRRKYFLKTHGAGTLAVIRLRKVRSTFGCREIAQLAPLASHPGIGHSGSLEELLFKRRGAAWNQAPTK